MIALNGITLIFNGLTLSLTLGFLILILWNDSYNILNQFFSIFLALVICWNIGSFLLQASILTETDIVPQYIPISIMEFGLTGAGVAIYILTTVLVGVRTRGFRLLAFSGLGVILGARVFLIVNGTVSDITISETVFYRPDAFLIMFYMLFDILSLYLVWFYRRKLKSMYLALGVVIFVVGQSLSLANPQSVIASFASSVSNIGVLILGFALLKVEIVMPLSERGSQLQSMHQVSLAVISRLSLDTVLDEIAKQATQWIGADGAGIFLVRPEDRLELVNVYNLPQKLLNRQLDFSNGMAGTVAREGKSRFVANYSRDWKDTPDFSIAKDTFGSVICVPLDYGGQITGVLMVITGKQGRLLDENDVRLLELIAAQAAVAISHSQLFENQNQLTEQLEDAHSQLSTVLESTKNPIIAVNRKLEIIFTNPATLKLSTFSTSIVDNKEIIEYLPPNPKQVLKEIKAHNSFTYELIISNKVFLCHIAQLGVKRPEGWVAVLNDVTELKELDRLKSEMVRMASHDLKNPLMGALAYVDLLRDDLTGSGNREAQRAITVIERQLERMNRIIGGVLDIERVKSTTSRSDVCDPRIFIEQAIHELDYMIADRNVDIQVRFGQTVSTFMGDYDQFERVVVNLIENAIKFSLVNPRVEISAFDEEDNIVIKIKDNGVGIPKELQDNIFDRFFRGNQQGVEHITGSGLGLSFVRTIVENHRGHIVLESGENSGTTFSLLIPSLQN